VSAGERRKRQSIGFERDRHELATGDLATLERLGEVRARLGREPAEHLDALELGRGRVGHARAEAPDDVGHDEQIDVVREGLEHEPGLEFLRRELDLRSLPSHRHDPRRTRAARVAVEIQLQPRPPRRRADRLLQLRGELEKRDA
jgi:hypothetical protein